MIKFTQFEAFSSVDGSYMEGGINIREQTWSPVPTESSREGSPNHNLEIPNLSLLFLAWYFSSEKFEFIL